MKLYHASALKTSSPPRSTTPLRRIHVAHHQTAGLNQIFDDDTWGSVNPTPSSRVKNRKEPPPKIRLNRPNSYLEPETPPSLLPSYCQIKDEDRGKQKKKPLTVSRRRSEWKTETDGVRSRGERWEIRNDCPSIKKIGISIYVPSFKLWCSLFVYLC